MLEQLGIIMPLKAIQRFTLIRYDTTLTIKYINIIEYMSENNR